MKFSAPALCALMLVAAANGKETGNNEGMEIEVKRNLMFVTGGYNNVYPEKKMIDTKAPTKAVRFSPGDVFSCC